MKTQEMKNIRLLVENEGDLYTPLSPENEFNENVKAYIRSKTDGIDYNQNVQLTVICPRSLDEEKFRSAVANWIEGEKALFQQAEKRHSQLQASLFITGFIIVILSAILKQYVDAFLYSIILIVGTAAMSRGVARWYEHVAPNKAKRWLINEMEEASTIVFEHTLQIPRNAQIENNA